MSEQVKLKWQHGGAYTDFAESEFGRYDVEEEGGVWLDGYWICESSEPGWSNAYEAAQIDYERRCKRQSS